VHRKATLGRRKEGVRRRPVRGSAHGRVEGGWPSGLHRKAILGCHEEGVRHQPAQQSAHGRVEGRPGGGACDSCGGPPTVAAASKVLAVPTARPAGAFAPTARKRRPAGG
jgi:hypothetical protein